MINLDRQLKELTVREFLDLQGAKQEKKYVYGISGLASIANCSLPTAQKLKNSGKIPFSQAGRKLIFEVDSVLSAISNH